MRPAAYLRFSSDQQRDASLDDQLRNIIAWCEREGIGEPAVYRDAALTGARSDRPGYLALVAAIDAGQHDLILVDDLSRLSRDSTDQGALIKRLRFAGVRLVGVSDGVDTARKGHKIDVGLRGLMSELYLDDLADKTHRGLTGRALSGASAGGLPYGYRVTTIGERMIDPDQSAIVLRIFERAAAGYSARQIAAELNADGVPTARGKSWCMSAIAGDHRRGIGILANPIYIGRQIWNRSKWIKHPEHGHRVRRERPESEWIISERPDLAIVPRELWDQAQAVLKSRRQKGRKPVGRRPRHLLSGILKCSECGGPMTVVDRYRYGCARAKDRGPEICASRTRVPRKQIEAAILETVKADLSCPEAFKAFEREARALLADATPDITDARRQLRAAEATRDNIMAAIKAGILTASTRAELIAAETEVERCQQEIAAAATWQPAQMLPRAREIWQRCLDQLTDYRDVPEVRTAIQDIVGDEIRVSEPEPGVIVAESPSERMLVAGAGFEPATFGL